MPAPQYTGSVSVPALGQFASATSVPATFAGAIATGPVPYALVSIGDINASRSASTGLAMLGGGTERGVLDFGLTNAHATTLQGIGGSATSNLIVQGTIEASANGGPVSFVAPGYTNTGAPIANTFHIVLGNLTASGVSTTITLTGNAAFTTGAQYVAYVLNRTSGTAATITTQNFNTVVFTSINTNVYSYVLIGV